MENISQSHENSTATLRPPHGLSPVKTLEAESVHEVVGGRGATLGRVRVRVRVRVSSQRAAAVPSVKVALYSAYAVITTLGRLA